MAVSEAGEEPPATSQGAAEDEQDLEPDDVVALCVAAERIKADRSLIHRPDLAFFKELLLSWGAPLESLAAAKTAKPAAVAKPTPTAAVELDGDVLDADGGPEAAGDDVTMMDKGSEVPGSAPKSLGPKDPPAVPAGSAPSVAVLELDSDEEEEAPYKEMDLKAGLLDEELADEEAKSEDKKPGEAPASNAHDPERLPKDSGPFPLLPPSGNAEPSDARKKVLAKVKQQAGEALATGDVAKALDRYTEAIRTGGATALMLATRAALLLKQRRPCAAIRDCCAALELNPDCGKAYHVRGVAHRKLGHWKKAHRDLSQGQRLDFSEESVNVHMFVANKVGIMQDQKTGRWYQAEGAKKAVELLFTDEGPEKKKSVVDLRAGQAVRIAGLQKAPHLNAKRGIVQRQNPTDPSRWEVELRLERGKIEVKSIKGENIVVVRAADAHSWKDEEAKHAEERKRREKEEKRWQEEEDKRKRMEEKRKATEWSLRADGFPDMDPSERLEAEMSALPLDDEAMGLLRKLRTEEALDVLQQVGLGGVGNLSDFIRIKVRQKLGDADYDDDFGRRAAAPAAAKPAASSPAAAPAAAASAAAAAAPAAKPAPAAEPADVQEEAEVEESSSDEDFDRLPEDGGPMPDAGYTEHEPTEEQAEAQARWKSEAAEALKAGDQKLALARYTKVISCGGGTALMLSKRSELLLKMGRPNAAIADCTAAIKLNPDLGKAFRVRGIAHRKLGHWADAKADLAQGQRLDFDDGTAAVEKFVAEKVRQTEAKAARKRRPDAAPSNASKRAKA